MASPSPSTKHCTIKMFFFPFCYGLKDICYINTNQQECYRPPSIEYIITSYSKTQKLQKISVQYAIYGVIHPQRWLTLLYNNIFTTTTKNWVMNKHWWTSGQVTLLILKVSLAGLVCNPSASVWPPVSRRGWCHCSRTATCVGDPQPRDEVNSGRGDVETHHSWHWSKNWTV